MSKDAPKEDAQAEPQAQQQPAQQQQQQVQVDDHDVNASYANFCRVMGSPEELIIDFGLNPQPHGVPKDPIAVKQRVIVNYYTAKRLLEKNKPGVLFTDLSACNGYANGEIVAQTLTSPAIFISGVRDKMTPPRAAEAMARKVANGTMATVADSGHGVMAEQPEAMQKLLFDAISA